MGPLYSVKDQGQNLKEYSTEELFALNLWLSNRRLPSANQSSRITVGPYKATIELSNRFAIGTDHNEVDWMLRQTANGYDRMFCMEAWKRFSYTTRKEDQWPEWLPKVEVEERKTLKWPIAWSANYPDV